MNNRGKWLERITGMIMILCVLALIVLLTIWGGIEIWRQL